MILYFNFNFWWQFWWQFRWQLVAIGGKMKNEILNCKILIKTCGDKMVTKWWQLVAIGGNWWQKCSFKAWFETDEYFNEMYSIIKKKIIFIKEKYCSFRWWQNGGKWWQNGGKWWQMVANNINTFDWLLFILSIFYYFIQKNMAREFSIFQGAADCAGLSDWSKPNFKTIWWRSN